MKDAWYSKRTILLYQVETPSRQYREFLIDLFGGLRVHNRRILKTWHRNKVVFSREVVSQVVFAYQPSELQQVAARRIFPGIPQLVIIPNA
jgi:hypothetical protein